MLSSVVHLKSIFVQETSIKEQSSIEVMSAKGKRRVASADSTVNTGNEIMEEDTSGELNEADVVRY